MPTKQFNYREYVERTLDIETPSFWKYNFSEYMIYPDGSLLIVFDTGNFLSVSKLMPKSSAYDGELSTFPRWEQITEEIFLQRYNATMNELRALPDMQLIVKEK